MCRLFPPLPSLPFSSLFLSFSLLAEKLCACSCMWVGEHGCQWMQVKSGNNLKCSFFSFTLFVTGSLVHCSIYQARSPTSFWDSATHLVLAATGWVMSTITLSFTMVLVIWFYTLNISQPNCLYLFVSCLVILASFEFGVYQPHSFFYEQKYSFCCFYLTNRYR